jgi:hypothetical protein
MALMEGYENMYRRYRVERGVLAILTDGYENHGMSAAFKLSLDGYENMFIGIGQWSPETVILATGWLRKKALVRSPARILGYPYEDGHDNNHDSGWLIVRLS